METATLSRHGGRMSDFLTRLVGATHAGAPTLGPRLPSRFAPSDAAGDAAALPAPDASGPRPSNARGSRPVEGVLEDPFDIHEGRRAEGQWEEFAIPSKDRPAAPLSAAERAVPARREGFVGHRGARGPRRRGRTQRERLHCGRGPRVLRVQQRRCRRRAGRFSGDPGQETRRALASRHCRPGDRRERLRRVVPHGHLGRLGQRRGIPAPTFPSRRGRPFRRRQRRCRPVFCGDGEFLPLGLLCVSALVDIKRISRHPFRGSRPARTRGTRPGNAGRGQSRRVARGIGLGKAARQSWTKRGRPSVRRAHQAGQEIAHPSTMSR